MTTASADGAASIGEENVARLVQRLQVGGSRARRSGSCTVADRQSAVRALLLRSLVSPTHAAAALPSAAGGTSLGFQLAFGHSQLCAAHLLAVVDEEGAVSIVDTAAHPEIEPGATILQPAKHRWLAHHNAVFDVIWTFDDTQIVTASGDLLVCGWDVESQRAAFKLHGHQMSVKSVRQVPDHAYLFGSGARDGHVLLWDTRVSGKPVASLLNVHAAPESAAGGNPAAFASPPGARKRKKTSVSSSPRSVTCIEFGAHGHEIVTAGAVDSVVKFWDVRRLTTAHHFKPTAFASRPVRAFSCSSHTGAHHGISSLEFDATKSKLLVSVLNDAIKVVDVHAAPTADPILQCSGHLATSFYVKAAFSPESDFIIGGSADGAVFIWNASTARASATHPRFPSVALKAHTSEVNGVAWHKRDFSTVASCSDDGTARYWRVDRSDAGGAVDDTSVGRGRSSSKHFELRREDGRVWSNWSDFCAQRDGFAYAVSATTPCAVAGASMEAVADAGEEAKRKTPFLVRRSSELLRRREDAIRPSPPPPVRRPTPSPSPPQTLLDFWRR